MSTRTTPLAVGDRVRIEKGCKALGINAHATATIKSIVCLGIDYSHAVRVVLEFNGRTVALSARHVNRLSEESIRLLGTSPAHAIVIRRAPLALQRAAVDATSECAKVLARGVILHAADITAGNGIVIDWRAIRSGDTVLTCGDAAAVAAKLVSLVGSTVALEAARRAKAA